MTLTTDPATAVTLDIGLKPKKETPKAKVKITV
jgi:hypothetical protein